MPVAFHMKVKQSLYRPGQAGGWWCSHISRQWTHEGGRVVSPTHRPPLPPMKLSWYSFLLEAVNPRAIVPLEGTLHTVVKMNGQAFGHRCVCVCVYNISDNYSLMMATVCSRNVRLLSQSLYKSYALTGRISLIMYSSSPIGMPHLKESLELSKTRALLAENLTFLFHRFSYGPACILLYSGKLSQFTALRHMKGR
jgi:hypothetical protein